ncbi:MAG: hypothetical protein LUF92_09265, partial [Clostridiales bacterium]|nr:hypothetical protein [Clostridiales bacterium]
AAIQSITNISSLYEIKTKGVKNMNMCTALEQLKNEGIELGRNEGIKLGRNEGIKLGRSEGIELGRNEGVQLGINESIIRLLDKGFSDEAVADMLDITIERIMEAQRISR